MERQYSDGKEKLFLQDPRNHSIASFTLNKDLELDEVDEPQAQTLHFYRLNEEHTKYEYFASTPVSASTDLFPVYYCEDYNVMYMSGSPDI